MDEQDQDEQDQVAALEAEFALLREAGRTLSAASRTVVERIREQAERLKHHPDAQKIEALCDMLLAMDVAEAAAEPLAETIRHEGDEWCVYSTAGKSLGCYGSEDAAKKRLAQVERFKHMREAFPELAWEETERRVRAAVQAQHSPAPSYDGAPGAPPAYPLATYPDRVVFQIAGTLYECPYTVSDGGDVALGEKREVVATYRPLGETIRLSGISEAAGGEGREWDVVLIEAGLSLNGNYYPAEVLKAAASLFEGTAVFADHATDAERRSRPERSIRDKVGRIVQVRYDADRAALVGRLKVIAPWLRETLLEAQRAGEMNFLGLSIAAAGRVVRRDWQGTPVNWVEAVLKVDSTDVVTDPAAGGRIVRLVASTGAPGGGEMTPEELAALVQQQVSDAVAAALVTVQGSVATAVQEAAKPATDLASEVAALKEAQRLGRNEIRITAKVMEASRLSEMGRKRVLTSLLEAAERRDVADEEIAAALTGQIDYEAAVAAQYSKPVGAGALSLRVGDSAADQKVKALRGMFLQESIDGVAPFKSLRHAYSVWTGRDPWDIHPLEITRDLSVRYDSAIDHTRITESITTSTWGEVYADNMYLLMMRGWGAEENQQWRKVVSQLESVPDFRTRHWTRVGGYGDLVAVAEQGTYLAMTSPTDEEVTYAVSKRGGLDDVTFESIVNDHIGQIRKVPVLMGQAAARTLNKTILNLVTSDNPVMEYDSVALYNSAHANTNTTALSLAGLEAAEVLMRSQTPYNTADEVLGGRNGPKYLIVPNELTARASRIVSPSDAYIHNDDSGLSTDTALDPQAFKGRGIEVITHDYLTDPSDWFAVADPSKVETIVVGFLGGQQEPELFVQDMANVGSNFNADKVTYKVRHIYGFDVLEHRSFFGAVGVA